MQFLKKIVLSAASLLTFSAVTFLSSCAPKNSCDTLVCKNGGSCAADFCNCPTGFDGPECQNKVTDRYIGTFVGWTGPRGGQPTHIDTVDVYVSKEPLTLSLARRRRPDIIYTGVIEDKNTSVAISDIVEGTNRTVVNVTIKAPSTIDTKKVLSLNTVDYENGNKVLELEFNGQRINY